MVPSRTADAGGGGGGDGGAGWECAACTFPNGAAAGACEMCGAPRPCASLAPETPAPVAATAREARLLRLAAARRGYSPDGAAPGALREERVAKAYLFLSDPDAKDIPLDKKIQFLEGQDISRNELDAAIARLEAEGTSAPFHAHPSQSPTPEVMARGDEGTKMGIGVEEEPREKPVKSDGAHAARPSPTPAELDAQDPIEGGDDSVRTPPSAEPAAEPETSAEDAPSPRLSDVYARSRRKSAFGVTVSIVAKPKKGPVVRVRLGSTREDRIDQVLSSSDLEVRAPRALDMTPAPSRSTF